jgi:two-component system, OmpR family, response regulator
MRILIVEDEPDLLANLAQAIREAGFAVDTAADGEEGLFKAETSDYDALILDVMLPKLDGWGLLKQLRLGKKTPVLMLTARDSISDRIHGLDSGADDYLTKPFDLEELLARVRALIRRASGDPSPSFQIGEIGINTASKAVTKLGKSISLTSREYALLEYLAQNRGHVISRTDLYEHLFDENDSSLSNLLDVHVSNLRKKLGGAVITTRRGQGYCIEA